MGNAHSQQGSALEDLGNDPSSIFMLVATGRTELVSENKYNNPLAYC